MSVIKSPREPAAIPERFRPSKATLLIDKFMNYFIKAGGVIVIITVLGMFLFIFVQVIPLFRGAKVAETKTVQLPKANFFAMGVDEWGALPFLLQSDGKLDFVDLRGDRGLIETAPLAGIMNATASTNSDATTRPIITASDYDANRGSLICGLSDGRFSIVQISYSSSVSVVDQKVEAAAFENIGKPGAPIIAIGLGDADDNKLIAALQLAGDHTELHAVTMIRKHSFIGGGELKVDGTYDLTSKLTGKPAGILVSSSADAILVPTTQGDVQYLFRVGDEFEVRQVFRPFKDLKDTTLSSLHFLFGDVSVVATSVTGENRVFSLYVPPGGSTRLFGQIKEFPKLPDAAT